MSLNYELYIEDIKDRMISQEEETRLMRIYQNRETGWEDAYESVVAANLLFVVKVAFEFTTDLHRVSDLISEGNLALLDAINRFDASRGVKLISYAAKEIRGRMIKYITRNGHFSCFHVSTRDRENCNKVRCFIDDFNLQNNRKPTSEEIKQKFGFDTFYVDLYLEMINSQFTSVNLMAFDNSISDYGEKTIELQDFSVPDPSIESGKKDISVIIHSIINTLPERDRAILNKRFGLNGEIETDLATIGLEFNLTKERIRQIEENCLKKIKKIIYKLEI